MPCYNRDSLPEQQTASLSNRPAQIIFNWSSQSRPHFLNLSAMSPGFALLLVPGSIHFNIDQTSESLRTTSLATTRHSAFLHSLTRRCSHQSCLEVSRPFVSRANRLTVISATLRA